jgi:hypothetical protein
MAAAYAQADGGPQSDELRLLGYLDRYGGALNVLGRPLGAKELRRMTVAENIKTWYEERGKVENMVEWTQNNPDKAEALHHAYKEAVKLGLLEGNDG